MKKKIIFIPILEFNLLVSWQFARLMSGKSKRHGAFYFIITFTGSVNFYLKRIY